MHPFGTRSNKFLYLLLVQEKVQKQLAVAGAAISCVGCGIQAPDLHLSAAVPTGWRAAVNKTRHLTTIDLGFAATLILFHHCETITKSSWRCSRVLPLGGVIGSAGLSLGLRAWWVQRLLAASSAASISRNATSFIGLLSLCLSGFPLLALRG